MTYWVKNQNWVKLAGVTSVSIVYGTWFEIRTSESSRQCVQGWRTIPFAQPNIPSRDGKLKWHCRKGYRSPRCEKGSRNERSIREGKERLKRPNEHSLLLITEISKRVINELVESPSWKLKTFGFKENESTRDESVQDDSNLLAEMASWLHSVPVNLS